MLTPVQVKVLDHYRHRLTRGGFSPSMKDAAQALGMSAQHVNNTLNALEERGYLLRHRRRPHGVELTGVVSLVGMASSELWAELARRGEVVDALDGGERPRLGGTRRYGAGTGSCAAPGCQVEVEPGKLMCLSHWRALPYSLQREILDLHRRARCTRNPEDAARFGDAVARARDLLDSRSTGAFEGRQ